MPRHRNNLVPEDIDLCPNLYSGCRYADDCDEESGASPLTKLSMAMSNLGGEPLGRRGFPLYKFMGPAVKRTLNRTP
jgi:hypothetical protein